MYKLTNFLQRGNNNRFRGARDRRPPRDGVQKVRALSVFHSQFFTYMCIGSSAFFPPPSIPTSTRAHVPWPPLAALSLHFEELATPIALPPASGTRTHVMVLYNHMLT